MQYAQRGAAAPILIHVPVGDTVGAENLVPVPVRGGGCGADAGIAAVINARPKVELIQCKILCHFRFLHGSPVHHPIGECVARADAAAPIVGVVIAVVAVAHGNVATREGAVANAAVDDNAIAGNLK